MKYFAQLTAFSLKHFTNIRFVSWLVKIQIAKLSDRQGKQMAGGSEAGLSSLKYSAKLPLG